MEFVCCAGKGRVFVSFGCNMVIKVIVLISWCNNEVIVIQYVIFFHYAGRGRVFVSLAL